MEGVKLVALSMYKNQKQHTNTNRDDSFPIPPDHGKTAEQLNLKPKKNSWYFPMFPPTL